MAITRTVIAVCLPMLASMWTGFAERVKTDNSDKAGCVPVTAGLGSRAIAEGDVIFEEGASWSSRLVKTVSGFDMSHVMMVAEADTKSVTLANQLAQVHVWIVESLEEGVKGRWLWNAMFAASSFRVHRLTCGPELAPPAGEGGCHGDWEKAASFLNFHSGSAYGFSRLFQAGLDTLSNRTSQLFSILDETDPCPQQGQYEHTEDYMCSEIVWGALQHGNYLPDDIRSFKGMSPKQLEQCALAGKRKNPLTDGGQTASMLIDAPHVPWHEEMQFLVQEAQACLDKDMVINFLKTVKMNRRMDFRRWSAAAQSDEYKGQGIKEWDIIKAKHAHGLFEDSSVTGDSLMDGLLDAFIILELTENFNEQCKVGSYVFLHGVGFEAPKLEIMSSLFCSDPASTWKMDY